MPSYYGSAASKWDDPRSGDAFYRSEMKKQEAGQKAGSDYANKANAAYLNDPKIKATYDGLKALGYQTFLPDVGELVDVYSKTNLQPEDLLKHYGALIQNAGGDENRVAAGGHGAEFRNMAAGLGEKLGKGLYGQPAWSTDKSAATPVQPSARPTSQFAGVAFDPLGKAGVAASAPQSYDAQQAKWDRTFGKAKAAAPANAAAPPVGRAPGPNPPVNASPETPPQRATTPPTVPPAARRGDEVPNSYYYGYTPPTRPRTPAEQAAAAAQNPRRTPADPTVPAENRGITTAPGAPEQRTTRDQVPSDGGGGAGGTGGEGTRGSEGGAPPRGTEGGSTGSGGGGVGYGGPPGGGGAAAAANPAYESPTGGLVGYYGGKMNSTGMTPDELNALQSSTLVPIQQQQQQATEAMMRVRAATGNDAGIYGGISELARNAANQTSQQGRQNVLTNADVARKEQAEGAAGNLNLYGQTQSETMEYLRMLGNLLGRQVGTTSQGSTTGTSAGIQYNPGGTM